MRPARASDRGATGLLYLSAAPYYDAFAGTDRQALRLLDALWERPGHTASVELTQVAELDGGLAGVLVAFPSGEGDRLARRFLALAFPRLPLWRWPGVVRHLRASSGVTPVPPPDALYVDALAVAPEARRRGVARALLARAEELAVAAGLSCIALDTGIENQEAQALYLSEGFERTGVQHAPDERTARAVGGSGFVSYVRAVGAIGTGHPRTDR